MWRPVPYRGKRNEPVYVKEIVKKIAEIKNLPEAEVAGAIVANASEFLGFKPSPCQGEGRVR